MPEQKVKSKEPVPFYHEWHCQINVVQSVNGRTERHADKLKITRTPIIISAEEAEILNDGALNGNNSYAKMYFLPEKQN